MEYQEFLEQKKFKIQQSGFQVNNLHECLFDFQDYIVRKGLKAGRYALFEDCGLGKTIQQLTWGQKVVEHTNKPVMILAPLAVSAQTIKQGEKFGIEVRKLTGNPFKGVNITNYEQLEHVNPVDYSGLILDESSILKNFEGSIRNKVIDEFKNTLYKLACTATPSPNDPMELGNHSEFLNVMTRNEMLAMFFVHDGGDTAKWRLKKHAIQTFWKWVNTWAIMLSKPSDLGFENKGFDLPKLNFIEKRIVTDMIDNGRLFNDMAISATTFNQELKRTINERLAQVDEVVSDSKENFIVWCNQNEESKRAAQMIDGAIEVTGSDTIEYKEAMLLAFAENQFRVLVTKPKIASFGLNYQNCHNQFFAAPDYSFEKVYQCIRRSLRFGQLHDVNAYMAITDTMSNVMQTFLRKQKQHDEMQSEMTRAMNAEYLEEKKETQLVDMKLPNFLYAS